MAVRNRSFSLDQEVDAQLEAVSRRFGVGKSRIVSEALRRLLPELLEAKRLEFVRAVEA